MISSFLSGCSAALGFAPLHFVSLSILSIAFFYSTLTQTSVKILAIRSYAFGYGFFATSLYWLVKPLTFDLDQHMMLIPIAIILIPLYFSSYIFLAIFFFSKIKNNSLSDPFKFTILWSLSEYAYGHFFTGLPWSLVGYMWNDQVMIQSASIFGIYGLSACTILIAALLGECIKFSHSLHYTKCNLFIALSVTSVLLIFGIVKIDNNKLIFADKIVRIVQANLYVNQKSDLNKAKQNLQNYLSLSSNFDKHVDAIIWPESAIPFLYSGRKNNLTKKIASILSDTSVLISGTITCNDRNQYYNSMIILTKEQELAGQYNKTHLVPFGEYVPLRNFLTIDKITKEIGDFDTGTGSIPINIKNFGIIAPSVCYEAIFSDQCTSINNTTDFMINITNDAWFEGTSAPFQHFQIARIRSVEHGISMIRSANYGISAIFGPCGQIICTIPLNTSSSIESKIPLKLKYPTPYSKFLDITYFIFLLILIIFANILNIISNKGRHFERQ